MPRPQVKVSKPVQPLASRTQPEACGKERAAGSVRAACNLWGKTQHLTSLCPAHTHTHTHTHTHNTHTLRHVDTDMYENTIVFKKEMYLGLMDIGPHMM